MSILRSNTCHISSAMPPVSSIPGQYLAPHTHLSATIVAIDGGLNSRSAVPAPLRLLPKRPGHSGHQDRERARGMSPDMTVPRTRATTTCSLLSRLPGQPVFYPEDGFTSDVSMQTSRNCNCNCKSPGSPTPSPLGSPFASPAPSPLPSPRFSSFSTNKGGPSLDFSSLFMRSETLRHDLENCTCHGAKATQLDEPPGPPAQKTDRSSGCSGCSAISGYTSIYSS